LVLPRGLPQGFETGAFPCPRSSPDSRVGALPPVPPYGFAFRASPTPSVLLRAGRFRLLSVRSRFPIASAPPLAFTIRNGRFPARPRRRLVYSLAHWVVGSLPPPLAALAFTHLDNRTTSDEIFWLSCLF